MNERYQVRLDIYDEELKKELLRISKKEDRRVGQTIVHLLKKQLKLK